MNEQLQQAVASLIDKSIKAFESGSEFMAGQLPDVVHQLLMWHMVLSAAKAAGAVILAIVLVIVDVKLFLYARKESVEDGAPEALFLGWGALGCLVRFPAWITTIGLWNLTWLQIWVAPKIFLIEYATRMVTK